MASKRRLRRKGCTGKQVHDKTGAVAHSIHLRKKKGERVHAYRCQFGNHWHVGHYGN